jgi:hypothetical protein
MADLVKKKNKVINTASANKAKMNKAKLIKLQASRLRCADNITWQSPHIAKWDTHMEYSDVSGAVFASKAFSPS